MRIYPVILCGGAGVRLWPASRASRPKQFIPLVGEQSLFQQAVRRMTGLSGGLAPVVVAGEALADQVRRQVAALGLEATLLLEPEGRDSGPAIAAAAAWIAARDADALAMVIASDHHIPDEDAFRAAVEAAALSAAEGSIVTFGVAPTSPATAYGYIRPGAVVAGEVRRLEQFVEKPDLPTAERYREAGYLWNSGNFMFPAAGMLDELRRHAPELAAAAEAAAAAAEPAVGGWRLGPGFRAAPKISIDYAVMEKTDRAAVLPVRFAWSDLGAWDAVWAASPKDADGNAVDADATLVGCRDSLIRSDDGRLIVGVGLERIAVVSADDALLVCDLGSAQGVKTAYDRIKAAGRRQVDRGPGSTIAADLPQLAARLHTWLHASALPLWWTLGADHQGGGFHEALDLQARASGSPRRARVQARQTYVYAAAGRLGWSGPWRQAMDHGLDFFLQHYLRADGLFRTAYDLNTGPVDACTLYDQAFALFALASAAAVAPDRADGLHRVAEGVADALAAAWRAPAGGYLETSGPAQAPLQSNPHMHLLEAALAWEDLAPGSRWSALADDLVGLATARFYDAERGVIREYFDARGAPATGVEGRIVEPGHQFEWAWLIERWGLRREDAAARAMARTLYRSGERGVDGTREAAMLTLLDDFTVHEPTARLWPQTERLKAALLIGRDPGPGGKAPEAFQRDVAASCEALLRFFETPIPGLWFDHLAADGSFRLEAAPASSFYHIMCALAELEGGGVTGAPA